MAEKNPKYPKPSIEEAIKIHNLAKKLKQPIPHFFDEDGILFYLDRTGKQAGGRQYFRNLGAKLSAEAKRKALKNKRTPTHDLYVKVYGDKTGTELFKQEQLDLKQIYTNTPTATHDVDHINSMASGGVHHSRNLRPQESSLNRSEGARGLNVDQKNALMLADDVEDHIRLQGPAVTAAMRDQITSKVMPRAFNRASVLRKAGRVLNAPLIGGTIAAGAAILGGAGPGEAATAFVDAENPLDGGSVADGSLQGAAIAEQKRRESKPLRNIAANEAKYVGNKLLNEMRYIKNSVMGLRLPYMPF